MFSEVLKESLAREVVGQPAAIHGVVRGVTRLLSGLTPRERKWCTFLLMGPPGTGRAHLVRTLARLSHGGECAIVSLNGNAGQHADPWSWLVEQLAPLFEFGPQSVGPHGPPRIVLIQHLELARPEFFPVLARLLETGELALPGGRRGRLDHSLIFLSSGLCSREILDESSSFGFSGGPLDDDEERGDVHERCRAEAEKVFGLDLLAQLDQLIVFRRLDEEHLGAVLESHFGRMRAWLAERGIECQLLPAARAFLVARGKRSLQLGARDLILAHRREVEFPVGDLLLSGQLPSGSKVVVDRRPEERHLHFFVVDEVEEPTEALGPGVRRVRVATA